MDDKKFRNVLIIIGATSAAGALFSGGVLYGAWGAAHEWRRQNKKFKQQWDLIKEAILEFLDGIEESEHPEELVKKLYERLEFIQLASGAMED